MRKKEKTRKEERNKNWKERNREREIFIFRKLNENIGN